MALRILPGVDVLEHRWAAAEKLFDEAGIEAVDHFTGADPAEIKSIISDELAKGDVHGIWMDAGDGAVAAIEAFEDAGADYPVMTGEDEMSFLRKWKDTGLTGLAPVYSNFQWRTPLLAAQMIFAGEEVPKEWVLPQKPITEPELDDYLKANEGMPDGHYAKFRRGEPPRLPDGVAAASDPVTEIRSRPSAPHPRGGRVGALHDHTRTTMPRTIAVNTWVWTSPLTDASLEPLARKAKGLGYDALELPLESVGDWDPVRTRDLLDSLGLGAIVVGAMGPGRSLVARAGDVAATQTYLRACIAAAQTLGAEVVAGPFYAPTGVTWRMDADERAAVVGELREKPRAPRRRGRRGGHHPRDRAAEPLRDEPAQHGRAEPRCARPAAGCGTRTRARHVSPQHRGEEARRGDPGRRRRDRPRAGVRQRPWGRRRRPHRLAGDPRGPRRRRLSRPAGAGELHGENATIAVAASVWRPLAPSQDELAARSIAALRAFDTKEYP